MVNVITYFLGVFIIAGTTLAMVYMGNDLTWGVFACGFTSQLAGGALGLLALLKGTSRPYS